MKKSIFIVLCGMLPMLMMAQKTTVTDCQGNFYLAVKIGSQYWMAENLQCTKYDTQSERAGAVLSTSSKQTDAPYYLAARYANTEYSANLTDEQRKRLGVLYNWAAAMGYSESQAVSQTGDYNGKRQGICPNGWHLPSRTEWNTLEKYCGGKVDAGTKLKSRSGWYESGNGTDDYGFCGLPAGKAYGNYVSSVGSWVDFWTSGAGSDGAYSRELGCYESYFGERYYGKDAAVSVRCIKD